MTDGRLMTGVSPVKWWFGQAAQWLSAECGSQREREAAIQAAKAALAAAVALLLTFWLEGPSAFLAPYAAVVTVTRSVHRSWRNVIRQGAVVVAGVLLAWVLGLLTIPVALAVPVAVFVGLLMGRWHRFGQDGLWVAVTPVILLVNDLSPHPATLGSWVLLSVTGTLIGALVNTLLLPPLHLRGGDAAVGWLSNSVSGLVQEMSAAARDGRAPGDTATTDSWARRSRQLRMDVLRTQDAVRDSQETLRWNPRRRLIRRVGLPLNTTSTVQRLGHVVEYVHRMAALLGELARTGAPPDPALAGQLEQLVEAVDEVQAYLDDPEKDYDGSLRATLEQARGAEAELGLGSAAVRTAALLTVEAAVAALAAPSDGSNTSAS